MCFFLDSFDFAWFEPRADRPRSATAGAVQQGGAPAGCLRCFPLASPVREMAA